MITATCILRDPEGSISPADWSAAIGNFRAAFQSHKTGLTFFGAPPQWDRIKAVCAVFEVQSRTDALSVKTAALLIKATHKQIVVDWIEGENKKT